MKVKWTYHIHPFKRPRCLQNKKMGALNIGSIFFCSQKFMILLEKKRKETLKSYSRLSLSHENMTYTKRKFKCPVKCFSCIQRIRAWWKNFSLKVLQRAFIGTGALKGMNTVNSVNLIQIQLGVCSAFTDQQSIILTIESHLPGGERGPNIHPIQLCCKCTRAQH